MCRLRGVLPLTSHKYPPSQNLRPTFWLREGLRLEQREAMLRERLVNALRGEQQRLEKATEAIESRSPQRILQLGFAVLRAEGKALKSVRELEKHRQLTVELSDGTTEITQTQ